MLTCFLAGAGERKTTKRRLNGEKTANKQAKNLCQGVRLGRREGLRAGVGELEQEWKSCE
jgi:hypothetical protein